MAVNDTTGASPVTKATTKAYRDNFDRVFGKDKTEDSSVQADRPTSHETENDKEKVQGS